jgi:hypothetical protein
MSIFLSPAQPAGIIVKMMNQGAACRDQVEVSRRASPDRRRIQTPDPPGADLGRGTRPVSLRAGFGPQKANAAAWEGRTAVFLARRVYGLRSAFLAPV